MFGSPIHTEASGTENIIEKDKLRIGECQNGNWLWGLFPVLHLGRVVAIAQITPLHCKDCTTDAKYQLLWLHSHQENGRWWWMISLGGSKKSYLGSKNLTSVLALNLWMQCLKIKKYQKIVFKNCI